VGSIFKLYVLGAVVQAIDDGRLAWETELTIDEEVRSLPTGELQELPDGATVTVQDAAAGMISISDNTAADLLVRAVGRDAVLQAFIDFGHHDPALNDPLLTTREFFWLGWGNPELGERWAAAGADERRALLEEVPAGLPDAENLDWSVPAWSSEVDWFATPDDLANTHFALQELARTEAGAPIRDILAMNPGATFDGQWTYVGFKGGSAIGVLAGAWYLERNGSPPIVITLAARSEDPAEVADAEALFWYANDAAQLVVNP
jgi:beta-lactamase class A